MNPTTRTPTQWEEKEWEADTLPRRDFRAIVRKCKRVEIFVCMEGTSAYFPTTKKAAHRFAAADLGKLTAIPCYVAIDGAGILSIG